MSDIVVPVAQQRAEGLLIGASDAGAILGFDRWKSPISVWRRLRGLDVEHEQSEPAEWGNILEPVVRGKYAQKNNVAVTVPQKSAIRDAWLRATPDGLVGHAVEGGAVFEEPELHPVVYTFGGGLLQVKTCSAYLADDWIDRPPTKYEIQVRVEMAVTGLPWADVACLIGGQRYVQHRVHRDNKLEENILSDLREFYDMTLAGKEPSPDHTDAWRAHVSSKMTPGKVVALADDDVREWMCELRDVRRLKAKAEREEAMLKNRLLLAMSAHGATALDGGDLGKVTAYKTGSRTDWKAVADDLAYSTPQFEAAEKEHTKPGTTWAIRTPSAWGEDDE